MITGSERLAWILWLHGIGAYAVLFLLAWKGAIIVDTLRRRRLTGASLVFLILLALLIAILATGFIWTYAGRKILFGLSLMTIHALAAIGLAALLAWHVLARRFILRVPASHDRRAVLRLMGVTAVGMAGWWLAGPAKLVLDLPGAIRRFTGSHEIGSLTGRFPVVSWLFDNPPPVRVERWALIVDGAVERPLSLTYGQLQQLAGDKLEEVLDCTGGWYSHQEWAGVRLGRLLDEVGIKDGAHSVAVEAVSGYGRRFALADARDYLLALSVGDSPLDHGHGFPIRLVAPGHRGFDWVKWVARVRVEETSPLWQPPIPL